MIICVFTCSTSNAQRLQVTPPNPGGCSTCATLSLGRRALDPVPEMLRPSPSFSAAADDRACARAHTRPLCARPLRLCMHARGKRRTLSTITYNIADVRRAGMTKLFREAPRKRKRDDLGLRRTSSRTSTTTIMDGGDRDATKWGVLGDWTTPPPECSNRIQGEILIR